MRAALYVCLLAACSVVDAQSGWREDTSWAPWPRRENHNLVSFKGRLWLLNGHAGVDGAHSDVWSSDDGANWTLEIWPIPWGYRSEAAVVVFNDRLWMIGGKAGAYRRDVWSTADGVNWTEELATAPWLGRDGHAATVFNGRIWIFGGWTLQHPYYMSLNDVWSSPDGVNWTQELAAAPWTSRSWHTVTVFNGRMWLIGGTSVQVSEPKDIWSSDDGVNWTLEHPNAPFLARVGHGAMVYHDRLWVVGGADDVGLNDAWSSADGVSWTLETASAPWRGRISPAFAVHNGRIWLTGGSSTFIERDVWSYGLHVRPGTLPACEVRQVYDAELTAREAVGTVAWVVTGGALPPGLALAPSGPATARLAGTPTQVGNFAFTVEVTDADGHTATQEVTLMIRPIPAAKTSASGCTTPGPATTWPLALAAIAWLRRNRRRK